MYLKSIQITIAAHNTHLIVSKLSSPNTNFLSMDKCPQTHRDTNDAGWKEEREEEEQEEKGRKEWKKEKNNQRKRATQYSQVSIMQNLPSQLHISEYL